MSTKAELVAAEHRRLNDVADNGTWLMNLISTDLPAHIILITSKSPAVWGES